MICRVKSGLQTVAIYLYTIESVSMNDFPSEKE